MGRGCVVARPWAVSWRLLCVVVDFSFSSSFLFLFSIMFTLDTDRVRGYLVLYYTYLRRTLYIPSPISTHPRLADLLHLPAVP
ncbi:hypothetical protein BJ912DRAFT_958424 [Pholiota molesta]|nr:hypothetical protein BJ912DRAFT_958424 [Pholiota molesta]